MTQKRQESPNDAELLQRFIAGEDEAVDCLVDKYQRPLFGYARRRLGSDQDAIDAVQDTWRKFSEHRLAIRHPRAWLFTVLDHECDWIIGKMKPMGPHGVRVTTIYLGSQDPDEEELYDERLLNHEALQHRDEEGQILSDEEIDDDLTEEIRARAVRLYQRFCSSRKDIRVLTDMWLHNKSIAEMMSEYGEAESNVKAMRYRALHRFFTVVGRAYAEMGQGLEQIMKSWEARVFREWHRTMKRPEGKVLSAVVSRLGVGGLRWTPLLRQHEG